MIVQMLFDDRSGGDDVRGVVKKVKMRAKIYNDNNTNRSYYCLFYWLLHCGLYLSA
jgi:hypothetical protein